MIASVPALAPLPPPETGASRKAPPRCRTAALTARAVSGAMVDMSMQRVPDFNVVQRFFASLPDTQATFNNDGTFQVIGGSLNFRASFDYDLIDGEAGGNLQFTQTGDLNNDGRPDFTLSYANGLEQHVYRLP